MKSNSLKNKSAVSLGLAITASLITFCISFFSWLEPLDWILYDRLLRLQSESRNEQVSIVAIDEKSLQQLGPLPWSRKYHAELIEKLTQAKVKAIGYDVLFNKRQGEHDKRLVDAVQANGKVVFPVIVESLKQNGALIELLPFSELYEVANNVGMAHYELGHDNIARGLYLKSGLGEAYFRSFSEQVLKVADARYQYSNIEPSENAHPDFIDLSKIIKQQLVLLPYKKSQQHFSQYSFVDLLNDPTILAKLSGKTVFVGVTASAARNADFLPVPIDRQGQIMPGVEINATLYEALANQSIILQSPKWQVALVCSLLVLVAFSALPKFLPRRNFYYFLLLISLILIYSWSQLHLVHRWWPLMPAILVLISGYFIWSWRKIVGNMLFFNKTLKRLKIETEQSLDFDLAQSQSSQNAFISKLGFESAINNPKKFLQLKENEQQLIKKIIGTKSISTNKKFEAQYGVIETRVLEVEQAVGKINFLRRFVEQTMDRMSDGVILSNMKGQIIYQNVLAKSYFPQLRAKKEHSLFELLEEIKFKENIEIEERVKQVLVEGIGQTLQGKSILGLDLNVGISLLTNIEEQDFLILNVLDISGVKREQRRQLEMIDFISHDLRSPMTSVLALLSRYNRNPDDFNVEDMSHEIERLTRSSLSLAEHFLMLSRAESDHKIALYPIEILDTIDNAIALVNQQAEQKGIRLEFDFDQYQDIWIKANQDLLERVIVNLLTNGIKYSPENSVIKIEIEQSQSHLCLSVIDQGEGISQEQMETIFKPFTRMQKHEVSTIKGIGLGLRFVKAAMLRIGGTVEVQSEPLMGSCFKLEFPSSCIIPE